MATIRRQTTAKPKRAKADSTAAALKAMVDAAKGDIQLPAHVKLRDGDAVFWNGVVRARTRE